MFDFIKSISNMKSIVCNQTKIQQIYIGLSVMAASAKNCKEDSDCDTANCEYCLSSGTCTKFELDYCRKYKCGPGDGDCDRDDCPDDLICETRKAEFLTYHPMLKNCGAAKIESADVCKLGKAFSFPYTHFDELFII